MRDKRRDNERRPPGGKTRSSRRMLWVVPTWQLKDMWVQPCQKITFHLCLGDSAACVVARWNWNCWADFIWTSGNSKVRSDGKEEKHYRNTWWYASWHNSSETEMWSQKGPEDISALGVNQDPMEVFTFSSCLLRGLETWRSRVTRTDTSYSQSCI